MRDDPVRVSILIVNYKAYLELSECLQSLQPFPGSDTEVVVVDHATDPDETRRVRERFSWARLVETIENPGFAAGVNRAAAAARGKYLLLLNPDCRLDGDVARALADWLDEHPDVGACGALVRESDGSIQESARRFPDLTTAFGGRTTVLTKLWPGNPWTRRNLLGGSASGPVQVDWVSGACTMLRREAFDRVGGMDEGFFLYWEDADLCLRLKKAGWTTFYFPGVGVTHLTGRSSAHARTRSLVEFHRSAFRYFWKHGGPAAKVASPLVFMALQARLAAKVLRLRFSRAAQRRAAP
jgi:GT2 family glycosyltransferase